MGFAPTPTMGRHSKQATCHPEYKHHAKGLCRFCYMSLKRAEYNKNPEYLRANTERSRKWKQDNPAKTDRISFNSHTKTKYGITFEQYEEMVSNQSGLCGLCGEPNKLKTRLHVDHNHSTGQIRKLLCHHCNTGLGGFFESVEKLSKAIEYLKSFEVINA